MVKRCPVKSNLLHSVLRACGLSPSDYTAHLATDNGSPSVSLPTRKSPMILHHHRLARGAAAVKRNWPSMKATLPLFTAHRLLRRLNDDALSVLISTNHPSQRPPISHYEATVARRIPRRTAVHLKRPSASSIFICRERRKCLERPIRNLATHRESASHVITKCQEKILHFLHVV